MLNSVIAERYANGLFSALNSSEKSDVVKEELLRVLDVFTTNKELSAVYSDPTIDINLKIEIIREIFIGMLPETLNLLSTVLKNGKQKLLKEIIESFDHIIHIKDNKKLGKLTVASHLGDESRKSIEEKISKELQSTVVLKESVDPNVLGGFKIEVGSFLIDATIKKQLENLKKLSI